MLNPRIKNNNGAIYAENAIIRLHGHQSCGSLGCLGGDTSPVGFRRNQSNFGDGAVIYADNSDVRINAVWLQDNDGESIICATESELIIERFSQSCWSNVNCNLIENNTGIVMVGLLNDTVEISSVNITGNNTTVFDFNVGHPATPPLIRVESCMINNNGGDSQGEYITRGLPDGTYYLTTTSFDVLLDVKYGNEFCQLGSCDPLQALPITVVNAQQATDKDFILKTAFMHMFSDNFE